jgi:hypothetical protein
MKRLTIKKYLKLKSKAKGRKAQTALEYALVVGAISLVLMAAWNVVGTEVNQAIRGTIQDRVMDNINKGNATVPR